MSSKSTSAAVPDLAPPAVGEHAAAAAAAAAPETQVPPPPQPPQQQQELDLAFCCDCTGSMGAYIKSAQDNIRAIASQIHQKKSQSCSLRFALVKYRDHPPQDSTFVTETYPFTKSLDVMKANVDTMAANGGGDGPEAVAAALNEVLELAWRPNAAKVCVFIADAPPHGLGENGDGFPNGDPDGKDPIVITKALAAKGITVYAIGVEPVLSQSYKFARDFMMMVAAMTEGKFLPLGQAAILAEVIVSTALEGLELQHMWAQLEAQVKADAAEKKEDLTTTALLDRVEHAMKERAKTVVAQQVEVGNPYLDTRYDYGNRMAMMEAPSLAAAKGKMKASLNAHVVQETAAYEWTAQPCMAAPAQMSEAQVCRTVMRGKKMYGAS